MDLMVSSSLCPYIAHAIMVHSWAIEPNAFRLLLSVAYGSLPRAAAAEQRPQGSQVYTGRVAVVPIHGMITPHVKDLTERVGWTISAPTILRRVEDALEDSGTDAVILDIDSPGGTVSGTVEVASELRALRDGASKPIVAISNYMCASAAYWVACGAAHEIVASPSALTGSLGVLAVHEDASGAYEQAGLKVEMIYAGKYKIEGNDLEPLSDEGRAFMQSQVNDSYGMFIAAVAEARGATEKEVRNGYGQGRVLTARAAKEANLIDRVATIREMIARLESPQARAATRRKRKAEGGAGRKQVGEATDDPRVELAPGETLTREEPSGKIIPLENERPKYDTDIAARVLRALEGE